MKRRIAIVASHPIQYHAHWYRELAKSDDFDLEVLYCHEATRRDQAESGFGVDFEWDVPLLEGYRYRFLKNVSRRPGVTDFGGTDSPELRGIIVRERYNAVVVSGWHTKSYCQAIQACLACGTPLMVRSDSHLHDDRSAWKQLVKWAPYRYFISRFDACLAAGTWSREYFLHYGARPERVFIVPHCVTSAPGDVAEIGVKRSAARLRWGIDERETVFLFAGKIIPRKRPFEFVRALAAASGGGAKVRGLVVGDGPLRAEMENVATSLRTPVTFAGFLNQRAMADAYAAADILVLPSDQDTWGLVVNEAMTYGRACIVSDRVGCGPDLIEAGRTGFVFGLGNVPELGGLMQRIACTPGLSEDMGRKAKELIRGHSAEAAAAALRQAVTAIMESR